MTYALVPGHAGAGRLDLEAFARAAGLHPELVRRLSVLGLIESAPDAAGNRWFGATQLAAVARIQRLRAGFGLNYAAVGLVVDLLEQIEDLQAALQQRSRRIGD